MRNADGNYEVSFEPAPRYFLFQETANIFHWQPGDAVYYFSAIFAPLQLNTAVYHRWSYYDDSRDKWIESSKLKYAINGGRGGGYRGYTLKEVIFPGKWRVEVLTETNQALGNMVFTIIESDGAFLLKNGLK